MNQNELVFLYQLGIDITIMFKKETNAGNDVYQLLDIKEKEIKQKFPKLRARNYHRRHNDETIDMFYRTQIPSDKTRYCFVYGFLKPKTEEITIPAGV